MNGRSCRSPTPKPSKPSSSASRALPSTSPNRSAVDFCTPVIGSGACTMSVISKNLTTHPRVWRLTGTGRPRLSRSVSPSYWPGTLPRFCSRGTTSPANRSRSSMGPEAEVETVGRPASYQSAIAAATVSGAPVNGDGWYSVTVSTTCRSVRPCSLARLHQLQAAGAAALLGQVRDVGERRVQVVLAEVVRAEGTAEEAELAVEVVVGLVDVARQPGRLLVGARPRPGWRR